MNRAWVAAVATLLVLALALGLWWRDQRATPPAPEPEPLPQAVVRPALERLARGVNLSNWLQHGRPTEARIYATDAADLKRIRALGLTHVRLPVDPAALLDAHGLPDAKALAKLRSTLEAAVANDLLVVLVAQLPPAVKAGVAANEANRLALAGHWRWLATALRDLPATHLAFEPLNEPEIADAAESRALVNSLAAEVRRAAPLHTIVVSGHGYSGVDELAALEPLHDDNVLYGFHFYEPHNFTHQGATWGDPAWKALRNFPYPSSPELVAGLPDSAPSATRDLLHWHGEERWNRARVLDRLAIAARWGKQHGVPVWCSEFGVLKAGAPAAGRRAWLRDVRELLEEAGIGWTHWDYAGPFGIVSGPRGRRVDDERAIEALGLKGG